MQVCPGCHTSLPSAQAPCALSPAAPPTSHWHPTTTFTPGVVQPPYVCGRMFQMSTAFPVVPSTGTCQVTSPVDRCIVVPNESCHLLCYLTCPHNCSAFRSTCPTAISKLPCAVPEARNLHTSGGGLVEGEKDTSRSISPEAKVNYPVSLNPFLNTSSPLTASVNKVLSDPSSSSPHRSPSPDKVESVWTAALDNKVLTTTRMALEESGWYYGPLSWQQAASMLQSTEVGTFLIRDSASPMCLYSLSVQTVSGPTSVRIHYSYGKFRLDCTGHSQKLMPEFGGLVELVEHYIHSNSSQVWVDHEGKTFSPINIRKPLRRSAPSLQHLCRLAINCTFPKTSTRGLPVALKSFLESYPHTC
ncbi:cytokine-inducible SH2-containing protein-like [Macrobrachium nipponense]|uniref:cytokine-inducible SH2-containing protein-like n=1 Tax=Macrobrachium nipponense TaxID=159736 RepID=UPI0030C882FD